MLQAIEKVIGQRGADAKTQLASERELRAKAEGEITGYQREIESLKTELIKEDDRI